MNEVSKKVVKQTFARGYGLQPKGPHGARAGPHRVYPPLKPMAGNTSLQIKKSETVQNKVLYVLNTS